MFNKVLVRLHAKIELPYPRWTNDLNEIATELEYEAKELTQFLRDHRSRDAYDIDIIKEYQSRCEFCGYKEERDDAGCPVCCKKAVDEWGAKRKR